MENTGRQSLDDSIASSVDETINSPCETGDAMSTDRQNSVETNRTYTIAKHSSWTESESSEVSTPRTDVFTDRQNSVATNRTYTIAKVSPFSEGSIPQNEESCHDEKNCQDDKMPTNTETPTEAIDLRHKLGSTPPLERTKDPAINSLGIIKELRKDGFIGCSTPLIPRNTRHTRSGISFEYFFRPNRMAPRLLPRLKSDGNVGKTLGTRTEVPRRESPLKKNSFRRKSPAKPFNRWHTGCRVGVERRRIQREITEHRTNQEKDDWKVVAQFWQELRQRKEREILENEERRVRERKILNELMGRRYRDPLP